MPIKYATTLDLAAMRKQQNLKISDQEFLEIEAALQKSEENNNNGEYVNIHLSRYDMLILMVKNQIPLTQNFIFNALYTSRLSHLVSVPITELDIVELFRALDLKGALDSTTADYILSNRKELSSKRKEILELFELMKEKDIPLKGIATNVMRLKNIQLIKDLL